MLSRSNQLLKVVNKTSNYHKISSAQITKLISTIKKAISNFTLFLSSAKSMRKSPIYERLHILEYKSSCISMEYVGDSISSIMVHQ